MTISPTDVACILLGFASFGLYALATAYMKARLRDAGIEFKRWIGPVDGVRQVAAYLRLARVQILPVWPFVCAVISLPLTFVLLFYGLIYNP